MGNLPLENASTNTLVVDTTQNIELPTEDIFTKLTEAELGALKQVPVGVQESTSSIINPQD